MFEMFYDRCIFLIINLNGSRCLQILMFFCQVYFYLENSHTFWQSIADFCKSLQMFCLILADFCTFFIFLLISFDFCRCLHSSANSCKCCKFLQIFNDSCRVLYKSADILNPLHFLIKILHIHKDFAYFC